MTVMTCHLPLQRTGWPLSRRHMSVVPGALPCLPILRHGQIYVQPQHVEMLRLALEHGCSCPVKSLCTSLSMIIGNQADNAILSMFSDLVSSGRSIRSLVLSVKPYTVPLFENIAGNPSVTHNIQDLRFNMFPHHKYDIPSYEGRWEMWQPHDPTTLRRLSLSFIPINDSLLRSLASYATLSCLDLHGHLRNTLITIIDTVKQCVMLETLNLQVEVVDVDAGYLLDSSTSRTRTEHHNLKYLTIRDDAEHQPGLYRHFGCSWILAYLELPALETLSLHWTRGCSIRLPPNVARDNAYRNLLGDEIFAFLLASKLRSLHTLSLYACEVSDDDIVRWLSAIPSLKCFYIYGISPEQEIYGALLRHHPQLEQLCVSQSLHLLSFISD